MIKAILTFEILGKPPEHIVQSLKEMIKKMGGQEGINIVNNKIHEPHQIEEEGKKTEFFTTFAEVEIEVETMNLLLLIVLNMFPSHVEIISPSEMSFKNFELGSILTDVTVKMHRYDEIAKGVLIERQGILGKLKEVEDRARETEERCRELEKEIIKKNK